MEITDCKIKTKCEINGCKNLADFAFVKENNTKVGICICKSCAKELYENVAKLFVPKSIPAPFKSTKKLKEIKR